MADKRPTIRIVRPAAIPASLKYPLGLTGYLVTSDVSLSGRHGVTAVADFPGSYLVTIGGLAMLRMSCSVD